MITVLIESDDEPVSQMQSDMQEQTRRKLNQWVHDTFALYEMADLTPKDCIATITSELVYATVKMLSKAAPTLTPKNFGTIMEQVLAEAKNAEEKKRHASA